MPELPEVEVVRSGLERHAVGCLISQVSVLHPRPIRRDPRGPAGFAEALIGRTIVDARRRGKYFWLPLDNGDALLGHLGMSGQMLIQTPGAPDERHLRVRFSLVEEGDPPLVEEGDPPLVEEARSAVSKPSQVPLVEEARSAVSKPSQVPLVEEARSAVSKPGEATRELRFVDQRMFGGLMVSAEGADLPSEIAHIARDPLDSDFDDDDFVRRVRKRSSGIKRLLLDQTLISGVGNIYADEALWRTKLHGERPGQKLAGPVIRELLAHSRTVMTDALDQGGTSFDALYVNVNGESGYFDRSLNAYGQEGLPCPRCGAPIRRQAFMNRSSYFCPVCQRPPRRRT